MGNEKPLNEEQKKNRDKESLLWNVRYDTIERTADIEYYDHAFASRKYKAMITALKEVAKLTDEDRFSQRSREKYEALQKAARAYIDDRNAAGIQAGDWFDDEGNAFRRGSTQGIYQTWGEVHETPEGQRVDFAESLEKLGKDGIEGIEFVEKRLDDKYKGFSVKKYCDEHLNPITVHAFVPNDKKTGRPIERPESVEMCESVIEFGQRMQQAANTLDSYPPSSEAAKTTMGDLMTPQVTRYLLAVLKHAPDSWFPPDAEQQLAGEQLTDLSAVKDTNSFTDLKNPKLTTGDLKKLSLITIKADDPFNRSKTEYKPFGKYSEIIGAELQRQAELAEEQRQAEEKRLAEEQQRQAAAEQRLQEENAAVQQRLEENEGRTLSFHRDLMYNLDDIEYYDHSHASEKYRKMVDALNEVGKIPEEERFNMRNREKFETLRDAALDYVDDRHKAGIQSGDWVDKNGNRHHSEGPKMYDEDGWVHEDAYETPEGMRVGFAENLIMVGRNGVEICDLVQDTRDLPPAEAAPAQAQLEEKLGFFASLWKKITDFVAALFAPAAQKTEEQPEEQPEVKTEETRTIRSGEQRAENWERVDSMKLKDMLAEQKKDVRDALIDAFEKNEPADDLLWKAFVLKESEVLWEDERTPAEERDQMMKERLEHMDEFLQKVTKPEKLEFTGKDREAVAGWLQRMKNRIDYAEENGLQYEAEYSKDDLLEHLAVNHGVGAERNKANLVRTVEGRIAEAVLRSNQKKAEASAPTLDLTKKTEDPTKKGEELVRKSDDLAKNV